MKRLTIKQKDNLGNEIFLEGIATYHDDESNKDFIVYTDKKFDNDGKLRIFFSLYKIVNGEIELVEVKTNEERKIGLEIIKEIIDDLKETN